MANAAIIEHPGRLAALAKTGLLDSPASPALDRLTRLTTRLLGVPMSVVSLIDRDRQVFAGATGLSGDAARDRQGPLQYSYCQHVVATARPLVVTDSTVHPLVHDNLATLEHGVRAYAGMPLITSDGHTLGAFCAFDDKPHEWSAQDLQTLEDLAQAAMTEIELRFAGRQLEEQGDQLLQLLDHTDELVARFGMDGALTYANRAWSRLLGAPPAEPKPGYLQSRVGGVGRAAFETAWTDAQAGESSDDLEVAFTTPDGDLALVELRLVPVLSHGRVRGVRLYGHDVTDLRRAEEAKARVLGLVSHELRTPIGAVQGAMQLLDRLLPADLTPKARELVALAKRNSDRMLSLVNDLLDLEKLETGTALEMRRLAMRDVFATALDATSPVAEQAGVRLDFGPGVSEVIGDAKWLAHVLINLVANAIKFTPAGGTVAVHCVVDGQTVQVRVRDSGRGIPADQLERIFERFAQVARSDATEKKGTGLGLTIAQTIVQQHGGRIWAESEMGQGATFIFTLPAAH